MLYTKFRGNRPAGSGEEKIEGFLPYMDMVAIFVVFDDCINKFKFPCT